MRKKFLPVAALLAAAPLVIAGCGSSADGESSDRGAVNNDASGFEDYFDNNPTGENVLSILGAGYPDALPTCNDNGISKNVMLIANTTNAPQTMSVTINPGLEEEAAFFPQYSGTLGSVGCGGYGDLPNTQYLTVQPGQTAVALLKAGGGTRNLIETSHQIAVGAGGQAWYGFDLSLNADEGFSDMSLTYSNTGGTDPSQNVQSGLFNVMACDTSSGGIAVTNTIVSTYQGGGEGANYGQNEPMCFAFIGEGADAYVSDPNYVPLGPILPELPTPVATPTDSDTQSSVPPAAPTPTPTDSNTPAPTPTPTPTPTPSPTSTIAEWDSRAAYQIGDLVTYQGATYRCTEAYQGYGDPSYILAPDLWVKVS